jgi:polyhydroxybutyrate depolymerase
MVTKMPWRCLGLSLALMALCRAITLPSDTLESQGRRWTYYSSSPAGSSVAPPLVLLFHGAGGSGGGFLDRSGWADKARAEGFVAVAPSGLCKNPEESPDFLTNPRVWNVGLGLFKGKRDEINDAAFVLDLTGRVVQAFHADPQKIYLVGHSNGATFCYRLATLYPARWAAVAGVAGPLYPALSPLRRPLPTYCLFGTEDPLLPMGGGRAETPWGVRDSRPLSEMLRGWGKALGYTGAFETLSEDEFQRTESYGPNLQVTYLKGHGHNYPSPGQPLVDPRFGPVKTEVAVNDLIWDFFKSRARP